MHSTLLRCTCSNLQHPQNPTGFNIGCWTDLNHTANVCITIIYMFMSCPSMDMF